MKLINIDEEAPEEFYIFVSQSNLLTQWNFNVTKTFSSSGFTSCCNDKKFEEKFKDGSASYLPFGKCQVDSLFLSPFLLKTILNYRIEYDAEIYRKDNCPLYPSRISAVFAFGSIESCEIAAERHKWLMANVRKFRIKEWPLTRVAKVNMEHVSLANFAYINSSMTAGSIENFWSRYWKGFDEIIIEIPFNFVEIDSSPTIERQKFKPEVLWEYLIEGVVECIE